MPHKRSAIRIFLADDHAVVRAGLKMLLNAENDMTVVGEAANGRAAVQRAPECRPDVLLLDISMPELSGLEAARRLREKLPDTKLVVLTMHDEEEYLSRFLEAGCSGYVLKKSADRDLIAAIRAVMSGETFVCPSMSQSLVDHYIRRAGLGEEDTDEDGPNAADELTPREQQVAALVAQGYSNKEIAERLFVSVKTIETHKSHIMEKLGFRRRAQLVRYAIDTGLINLQVGEEP